jgi:hypothetical protein
MTRLATPSAPTDDGDRRQGLRQKVFLERSSTAKLGPAAQGRYGAVDVASVAVIPGCTAAETLALVVSVVYAAA